MEWFYIKNAYLNRAHEIDPGLPRPDFEWDNWEPDDVEGAA